MAGTRETPAAHRAWLDYLNMGDDRSLASLLARYVEPGTKRGKPGAPTRLLSTLEKWSSDHHWQARLRAIADQAEAEALARIKAERQAVFNEGLGLDFERVRVLKRLAQRLIDDLVGEDDADEPRSREDVIREVMSEVDAVLKGKTGHGKKRRHGTWLQEPTAIGMGRSQRFVLLDRFNRDEIETLRGLLDDIAKETGGRPRTLRIDADELVRRIALEEAGKLGLSPEVAQAEADKILREHGHAGR